MAVYKVIVRFTDIQDYDHEYHEGDVFPRGGMNVTQERLSELASNRNRRGIPLIEEIQSEKTEKVIDTDISKEGVSEVTEEPVKDESGVSPSVKEKPKKRTRKTQE
jgi:hypothetical protein